MVIFSLLTCVTFKFFDCDFTHAHAHAHTFKYEISLAIFFSFQEDLRMYQERNKAVDSRTIKKVVEAKARKKRRANRQHKKIKKMTDLVTKNPDMTQREKTIELNK